MVDVDERVVRFEREVFDEIKPRRMLEVGCYDGQTSTMALLRAPWMEKYVGLDLSKGAIERFRSNLNPDEACKAELVVGDFIDIDLPRESFDVVYMHGVLHHFPDFAFAVRRIKDLLVPGGSLVTFDPMLTNPLFRIARGAYRPFQSDREWEWPLKRGAFELLEKEFTPRRLQGYLGREMYAAITCAVMPVRSARRWVERARQADTRLAIRPGRDLYRCNTVTMWWQKAM